MHLISLSYSDLTNKGLNLIFVFEKSFNKEGFSTRAWVLTKSFWKEVEWSGEAPTVIVNVYSSWDLGEKKEIMGRFYCEGKKATMGTIYSALWVTLVPYVTSQFS